MKTNVLHFALAMGLLTLSSVARADAQNAPEFQVISTSSVENIQGVNGRGMTWKNNKTAKGVVLLVKATLPTETVLWTTDFTLSYRRNGSDDRSRCAGITTALSTPSDEGAWIVGDYAFVKGTSGVRYFRLLFGLENEVNEMALQFAQPVVQSIAVARH